MLIGGRSMLKYAIVKVNKMQNWAGKYVKWTWKEA